MIDPKVLIVLLNLVKSEVFHFLFSGLGALLGYYLTSIILFASYKGLTGNQKITNSVVVCFILLMSILVGLCLLSLAHAWLDGLSIWVSTPLGPPLTINKGG